VWVEKFEDGVVEVGGILLIFAKIMEQEFSSTLLENAVTELSRLPGVGRKTALRLALHILRQEESVGVQLGEAIIKMRREIRYCKVCHNISQEEVCPICANPRRDSQTVCVVENVQDVLIFERTGQYRGLYHVLNGLISPMDGVGPEQLTISSLVERVRSGSVNEVILALSATMEGDTTNFYIYRQLSGLPVKITQLARGVAVGNEIEYTDEVTLGRSLLNRTPFADSFKR
jgi:recombination protein RecR